MTETETTTTETETVETVGPGENPHVPDSYKQSVGDGDAVETKSCPHCTSEIPSGASKCPECGGAVGTAGAVFAGVVATLLFGAISLVFEPAIYGALFGLLFSAWIVFVGPDQ